MLPNADALIRRSLEPTQGLVIKKDFGLHGFGKIVSINRDDPTKYVYNIKYQDGVEETMDLLTLRPHLEAYGIELRAWSVKSILGAYDYLERRLTGNCASPYDCRASYLVCELARLFDPSFAAENDADINEAWVRRLSDIAPIENYGQGDADNADDEELSFVSQLCRDLPLCLVAAKGFTCNHGDVDEFTEAVLNWWKNHGGEVGVWAVGAQIVFALSPNSAAAERIFSQMKDMFDAKQAKALADILQASMLLRYHKRMALPGSVLSVV